MVRNIITNLCHHLEVGIDGNLDIGNKRVIVGTPTITLTNNILTISCDTVGASIYYTLDGSTPTSSSTKYTTAVTLNNSCTIKAIAIKGNKSSIVISQDYIAILTAWKMLGNSVVHTDEYLTQWKVEGNSVVDNNAILSCGDYSDVDGKYHVKISNGVTIYDIPLTEPLRKVGNVADNIEFADGIATVTRNIAFIRKSYSSGYNGYFDSTGTIFYTTVISDIANMTINESFAIIICNKCEVSFFTRMQNADIVAIGTFSHTVIFRNYEIEQTEAAYKAWLATLGELDIIYRLETPITETIQVSPFPISPTDTYTSANDTPYSAFEYKKNVEIWSCGEYSAVDGKYHILVQPLGGSIADIAFDEPLRKVNSVADSIEFADGVAMLTRLLKSILIGNSTVVRSSTNNPNVYRWGLKVGAKKSTTNLLNTKYAYANTKNCEEGVNVDSGGDIQIFDSAYSSADDAEAFKAANADVEIIFELATPTTETIQVPQIEEADSYSCVISQGGKAVEWSSFTPNPD